MAFIQGFISGFEVSSRIRDRARGREIQERTLNLADAANVRANQQATRQQSTFDTGIERQANVDEATSLFADMQRAGGFENLTPVQQERIQELQEFDPRFAAQFADKSQLDKLGREAEIAEGAFRDQRPSLGDVAAQTQGDSVTPTPGVAPEVIQGPSEEGTPAPAPALEAPAAPPLDTDAPSGTRKITTSDLEAILGPGAAVALGLRPRSESGRRSATVIGGGQRAFDDPGLGTGRFAGKNIEVLEDFPTPEAFAEMDLIQQETIASDFRKQMGGAQSGDVLAAARQQRNIDETTSDTWDAFVNNGVEGQALREMVLTNPGELIATFDRDLPRLLRESPDTAALVANKLAPVIQQIKEQHSKRVAAAIDASGGTLDSNDPEIRESDRLFQSAVNIQQAAYDDHLTGTMSQIRGNSVPVGDGDFQKGLIAEILEAPQPGQPPTRDEMTINQTLARRAMVDLNGGARRLTTRQIEAFAWLTHRGYITPEFLTKVLSGKAFEIERVDYDFISQPVDEIGYRTRDDGQIEVYYTPPTLPEDSKDLWAQDVQDWIDGQTIDLLPRNAKKEQRDEVTARRNGFYIMLEQDAGPIFGLTNRQIDLTQLQTLRVGQVAIMYDRYQTLPILKSAYEDGFFGFFRSSRFFGTETEEKFRGVGLGAKLDAMGEELGVYVTPLPESSPVSMRDINDARVKLAALAQSDDPATAEAALEMLDLPAPALAEIMIRQSQDQRQLITQQPAGR